MAEFAFEPEPEVQLAAGESAKEISGRSPWRIAGRRLVRNRLAMASLVLFLLIVVVSLLAPVLREPHREDRPVLVEPHRARPIVERARRSTVVQQTQRRARPRRDPDRPDLAVELLHRRRQPGPRRDGARALRRPRLAADRHRLGGDLLACSRSRSPSWPGFFRGWTDSILSRVMDLIWAFPVYLLAISLATVLLTKPGGLQWGPVHDRPVEPLGPDLDHRDRLRPLRLPAGARPGAVGAREGVRRGLDLAGRLEPAPDVQRDPPQRDLDRDRAAAADDRDHDPDRGGALVPRDRRAGAAGELGDGHRRRPEPALHAALGGDRSRGSSSCSRSCR